MDLALNAALVIAEKHDASLNSISSTFTNFIAIALLKLSSAIVRLFS
jgi:hypothetical protein